MVGVYNRKLFRKTPARDQLNRMGGILASSDALIQEALGTAYAAPTPSDLGPMRMPQPQPVMQQPRPQVQAQPFQGIVGALPVDQQAMPVDQQAMPAEEPMMEQSMGAPMGMEPMPAEEPMMEEMPEAMPPGMPPSAQMAPVAFQEGGVVRTTGVEQGGFGGRFGGGFLPPGAIPGGNATVPLPEGVDITAPAGEVAPAVSADAATTMAEAAMDIAQDIDTAPPEETGARIVETAAGMGAETSGDLQTDLASIYQQLTGDAAAFEKNIDDLNRGIIGAAIAAGTSARATQNIAQGLLVGLQGARETEDRRAKTAQALRQAVLQAAGRAQGGGGGGAGSQNYESPIDAFSKLYTGIINQGIDAFEIPEGMAFEDYAAQQAERMITRMYTPEQLVGTRLEGLHSRTGAPVPGPQAVDEGVPALTDAQVQDMLGKARAALAQGKSRAAVEDTLRSMGIDPGLL